jgi:RHS repeat-associated protein
MNMLQPTLAILLLGATALSEEVTKPNRTLPSVTPPKTALEFSPNPTVEEISRARVFQEPLVPIGGEPTADENVALAGALLAYAKRDGPDDFASLTGFLEQYPGSPWRAALLTGLGFEYYNTAHYSLALEAWSNALQQGGKPTNVESMVVLARAREELALLYARLGRMTELEALLKPYGNHGSEKINQAREALWLMKNQPGTSFRCGPLALRGILTSGERLVDSCSTNAIGEISKAASTTNGFSLTQVAELAKKIGLNYQMAFRTVSESVKSESVNGTNSGSFTHSLTHSSTDFIVPSIVHWKVGHYAAMVQQVGDRYLLADPTFGNTVWATREALETETSGYFLLPPGALPRGWRPVGDKEGASVWGKGITSGNDGDVFTRSDLQTGTCRATGMPVFSVHLMTVNLSIHDTPLAYTPPVGPAVRFTFRYNSRDPYTTDTTFGGRYWNGLTDTNVYTSVGQFPNPGLFISGHTRITHDWISFLVDSPQSPLADVKYFVGGGGVRTFKNFDTNSQMFAFQQFDQTLLRRTGTNSYEMIGPDGSKMIFGQSDGSVGSGRRVYLTQIADPSGNALTFTYDQDLRVVAVTDAIGQVTTVTYGDGTNAATTSLTRVTDPFGRSATFDYDRRTVGILEGYLQIVVGTNVTRTPNFVTNAYDALANITDMLGLSSQPYVSEIGGDIPYMTTPYGITAFSVGGGGTNGNTRFAETIYPDGGRERVEFSQLTNTSPNQVNTSGIPFSEPPTLIPVGMTLLENAYLTARNTFYWSRNASASNYGDRSKAKVYHWLEMGGSMTSGILDSTKEPLENRAWYDYGQLGANGIAKHPNHIGRVLDDGTTQLYTEAYDGFGHLTNSIDPLGRTLRCIYATNGVDLLEVRQTRAANNELLFRATYDAQHRPLTIVDAAGQTNRFTYNARGQRLTATNPKGEKTAYSYDTDGYLIAVDGPLPGTNDMLRATYDFFGRVRTMTSVSGYTLTFDYDAMDRATKITHPDGTFEQFTYDRLDLANFRDRAGRQTFFEYDEIRQLRKRTDPLGRVTRFDWCRCGQLRSLTDPMGRTTTWLTDVQGRPIAKQYADGSSVTYQYENSISRLHAVIDEKQQVTQFTWNRDNTLRALTYGGAIIPTPGVSFSYDPDYPRILSMTDGTGTTRYSYNPITGTPTLGAGALASVDGPLPNDTIAYGYDELGRPVHRAINGVDSAATFDAAGRLTGVTNALGAFAYAYDGVSGRLVSKTAPNGQTMERSYGNTLQDLLLQRITHTAGATPISEFLYGRDITRGRLTTWSQQAGAQSPDLFTLGYDAVNQLLSATVTNAGNLVNTFAYSYDPTGNRLTEQVGASNYTSTYNGLNEIRTTTAPGATRTNEWDGVNRLVAVIVGNQRTEFTYDGLSRRVGIRQLVNGSEVSHRRFVWCGRQICEERDAAGVVVKRFFPQGMKLETGPVAGAFYYTRDHLGSIRELTDTGGNVRARYAYDPYGRRAKLTGDLETDFGFAGMFWSAEANLALTHFRAYDTELGRWLSRDPLPGAELFQGPNLYAYVRNEPVSRIDPEGLIDSAKTGAMQLCMEHPKQCREVMRVMRSGAAAAVETEAAAAGGGSAAAVVVGGVAGGAAIGLQTLPQFAPQIANTLQCGAETTLPAIETSLPAIEADIPIIEQTFVGIGPASQNGAIPYLRELARLENISDRSWWDLLTTAEQWIGITAESTGGRFTLRELIELWETLFGEGNWGNPDKLL